MYVVHALWLREPGVQESVRNASARNAVSKLAVWAEDSTRPPAPPRRPGRAPRVRPHPFAASPEELVNMLGRHADTAPGATVNVPSSA